MAEIEVVLDDITTMAVDAVVNAANSSLMGGGGVDGAIHRAGGPAILAECREIVARRGRYTPGDAVVSGGGELQAQWVIHAVGPIWDPAEAERHDRTLASAYRRSMERAEEVGARSVAFPNISTGVYGFPKERAAEVAIDAVRAQLVDSRVQRVVFVCFDAENHALYVERLGSG